MMNRRQALHRLGVASAGLALAGVPFHRVFAQGDEIVVGNLLDSTGPINIYGLPMVDATKFAIDDVNAGGGVLGKKLRLIQFDTQSNNQLYTQYATQLILENQVAVLMGGITSASREAMRPVIDKYRALYFYNEQYEGGVCDKNVFCTGVTPAQQIGVL